MVSKVAKHYLASVSLAKLESLLCWGGFVRIRDEMYSVLGNMATRSTSLLSQIEVSS